MFFIKQSTFITLNAISLFVSVLTVSFPSVSSKNEELINRIIKKWAPLVWLAKEEKHFPMDIDEFLTHVYPGDIDGKPVSFVKSLPIGKSSKDLYLYVKDGESLKKNTSFLNGSNTSKSIVPVYVTVSKCKKRRYFDRRKKQKLRKISWQATYWMFYPFNKGKEMCFIKGIPTPKIFNGCLGEIKTVGNHIGDFERVSISFNKNNIPIELFLSVHDIGVYYAYDPHTWLFKYSRQIVRKILPQPNKYPKFLRTLSGRPVIYSAIGSHGLWSAPGSYEFLQIPKFYDHMEHGTPWKTWKDVRIFHLDSNELPIWTKYLGKWGTPKSMCFLLKELGVCRISDGPPGILRKNEDFKC